MGQYKNSDFSDLLQKSFNRNKQPRTRLSSIKSVFLKIVKGKEVFNFKFLIHLLQIHEIPSQAFLSLTKEAVLSNAKSMGKKQSKGSLSGLLPPPLTLNYQPPISQPCLIKMINSTCALNMLVTCKKVYHVIKLLF